MKSHYTKIGFLRPKENNKKDSHLLEHFDAAGFICDCLRTGLHAGLERGEKTETLIRKIDDLCFWRG